MTPANLFRATLGQTPDGFTLVNKVADDTRMLSIYSDGNAILFAFGPTLGNLYVDPGETWAHFWKQGTDWLENFKAWKKVYSVGSTRIEAHAGFVEEYVTFRETITKTVSLYQPRTILVAGYSQGGAHATLCHRDLIHNYPNVRIETSTFASPKVYGFSGELEFDKAIVDNARSEFCRYEVNGDPIVKLAPWWLNYFHVGPVKRLGPKVKDDPKYHEPQAYIDLLEKL